MPGNNGDNYFINSIFDYFLFRNFFIRLKCSSEAQNLINVDSSASRDSSLETELIFRIFCFNERIN